MVTTDTRSVGELERRVEAFDATTPDEMDDDDRARLTDALVALADAYGNRGEFDAEAEMIERLDRLGRSGADDPVDVEVHLAVALANATSVRGREHVYETAIDPDRLAAYRDRIASLYDRRPEAAIAAPLARATAETIHANAKGDRRDRIGPLVERIETVYDAHQEPDVAASLLRAYAHAERYLGDEPEPDRLARAEELFGDHPDGAVAAGLAGVLAGRTNADAERTDVDAIEDRIGRIEALADRYPAQEESVLRWLPVATANATRASFEAAEPSRVDHWADVTAEHHDRLSTPSTATWCAVATFFSARASFFEGDVAAGEDALERLEELEQQHDNPVFEHWLGRAMFDAARSYVETDHQERAKAMVEDLAAFAVGHEDREEIERGLDALRTHAPQLFDEADVRSDESGTAPTDPEELTHAGGASTEAQPEHGNDPAAAEGDSSHGARNTDISVDVEATDDIPTADATDVTDTTGVATETVDTGDTTATGDSDLPGCGNCGEDGCGNCETGRELKQPASGPVLAAAAVGVAFVCLSVAYTLYRAQRALWNTLTES